MEAVVTVKDKVVSVYDFYQWTRTFEDPRTQKWLLVENPGPVICFLTMYFSFLYWGPKFMKNREAFQLKPLLLAYNALLVVLNFHVVYEVIYCFTKLNYSWLCQPHVVSYDPLELRLSAALWWYYISKLIEFLDTIFFILRKKNNQVTFLHVFHHSTMFWWSWVGIKWEAGGSTSMVVLINGSVHVFMYSYYAMAACGAVFQKVLWIKKYITRIQLAQFVVAVILGLNGLVSNCQFPVWMKWTFMVFMVTYLYLFSDFYIKMYKNKKSMKEDQNQNGESVVLNGKVVNGVVRRRGTNPGSTKTG